MRALVRISVAFSFFVALAAFAEDWTVTTLGGRAGAGWQDGNGKNALFNSPFGIDVDSAGNVYVADMDNHVIRKITPSGDVSTVAGVAGQQGATNGTGAAARFSLPMGVVVDPTGNLYVAEGWYSSASPYGCTIRKITPSGVVTTLAGTSGSCAHADGLGTAARFGYPSGLTLDAQGNVVVADHVNSGAGYIRKITPAGAVTTLAQLNTPGISVWAVAVDSTGNVYYAGSVGLGGSQIGKVSPTGVVTILNNSNNDFWDGPLSSTGSRFNGPFGIAFDSSGTLYVADRDNHVVRKITPDQTVATLAGATVGNGNEPIPGDFDGTGTAAKFWSPVGVATDGNNNIYVADNATHSIRKITPGGVVTTLAGHGALPITEDGPAEIAKFGAADAVVTDRSGNTFVLETYSTIDPAADESRIRMITPAGMVSTLTGLGGRGQVNGSLGVAKFQNPNAAAFDASGNLYVVDGNLIRRITTAGMVEDYAGNGFYGTIDGPLASAEFESPQGLAIDSKGNIYVSDYSRTIRKIAGGVVTTFAGSATQTGAPDGIGGAAGFQSPSGLSVDASDNIYVADVRAIRKITPQAAVTTLAGHYSTGGGISDGVGSAASFVRARALTIDNSGNLYVSDDGTIRKITPTGVVATIAAGPLALNGSPQLGFLDGTGSAVRFGGSDVGLAFDSSGRLMIADSGNARIRVGRPAIADSATVVPSAVTRNTVAQFGTTSNTATTWSWSFVRRPAAATAQLSSTTVRNPTFTPDVSDVYILELRAENASGIRISTVDLTASDVCNPLLSVNASVSGATTFCDLGTGGTATATANPSGVIYQWGWRATTTGAITNIAGATAATYTIRGHDIGRTGTVYLVCTITPQCGGAAMTTSNIALTLDHALCSAIHGDANGDGSVSAADIFYLINYLFAGGSAPIGPSDVNGDGTVNAADIFYLINNLFAGGPAPK